MAMNEYKFTVKVRAETREQAARVMGERILFDEDYGFPYELWVDGTVNDPSRDTPVED